MRGLCWPLAKGAVFVAVTVLATALLAITIANQVVSDTVGYRAQFTDITSLNPGDDVRMSGVRVGQVEAVRLVERRLAEVDFSVEGKRKLAGSATATIKFRNLVGQRYIAIEQGDDQGALAPGALIPVERTRPALDLTALFNGFKPLFKALSPEHVNKLAGELVQVLQGEGGTVEGLLRHTASLTSTLADKDKVFGAVVTNLNTVLDTVNARGDKLSGLVGTVQQLVSGLAKDAAPIGAAIGAVSELTTTASGLLEDGRAPLKAGIAALGGLSRNLADHGPELDKFLRTLPIKTEAVGRLVSYGSWFNFFLCAASADVPPAPGGPPVGLPVTQARCQR